MPWSSSNPTDAQGMSACSGTAPSSKSISRQAVSKNPEVVKLALQYSIVPCTADENVDNQGVVFGTNNQKLYAYERCRECPVDKRQNGMCAKLGRILPKTEK